MVDEYTKRTRILDAVCGRDAIFAPLADLYPGLRTFTAALRGRRTTARAYVQGLETAWRYGFAQNWAFLGTVTYTYGQNSTAHEPLRRIPPVFTRFVLDYSPRNWSFQAEWLSAGKQDRLAKGDTEDNRIPTGGTPAWKLLNWDVGHAWSHFSVRVSALNLFDEDYRTHGSGVNGVGRSVFGTMAIRF